MTPPQPAPRDRVFEVWAARVAELAREHLGKGLESFPGLPLRAGFECGDTPVEFFAGCLEDHAAELESWRECYAPPG